MSLLPYIERLAERQNLAEGDALAAMQIILEGRASQPQIAAFLMGMRMKTATVDELVGFARALREKASPVDVGLEDEPLLDTCGTGGDCAGTFNISTVAAMIALAKAYVAMDASLAEINPFILTRDAKVYALDAKINFDDNAIYRHKELVDLRDLNEEDPLEVEASRFGLNYIKLDGTVGCMVNGAGLAMATMDIIKYAGGSPANFLDVGGGASAEQVKNAFRILLSDRSVKAVLINIFGGILRCDTLATGVVAAARDLHIAVPIVVRMEGTNVELGRQILMESGLNFTVGLDMRDAAQKVVRLAA